LIGIFYVSQDLESDNIATWEHCYREYETTECNFASHGSIWANAAISKQGDKNCCYGNAGWRAVLADSACGKVNMYVGVFEEVLVHLQTQLKTQLLTQTRDIYHPHTPS